MKATDAGYGTFHISMMTDGSVKKPITPTNNNKLGKKKDLVVPNPNDRVVHQKLYEYLRDEKARRDQIQEMNTDEFKQRENISQQLKHL